MRFNDDDDDDDDNDDDDDDGLDDDDDDLRPAPMFDCLGARKRLRGAEI